MKVTAKRLRKVDACEGQVEIFEKEWPNGAKTTLKNLLRAVELGLGLVWFAEEFLSGKRWKEYNKKIVPARKEYEEKIDQALKEYYEKTAPDRKEYDKKRAQVRKEYEEKGARILFDILKRK